MKNIPFKTCRAAFTWLWMCEPERNIPERQKLYYAAFGGFNYLLMFLHFVSSLVYFLQNGVDDLANSLYALNQVSGFLDVLVMMTVAHILRSKINDILTELTKIYESSKFIIDCLLKKEIDDVNYHKIMLNV